VSVYILEFIEFLFSISILILRKLLQDTPIEVLYPTQAKLGLWGGEGVIPGYRRPFQTGFRRGMNYLYVKKYFLESFDLKLLKM
jgi:hypothetical protein